MNVPFDPVRISLAPLPTRGVASLSPTALAPSARPPAVETPPKSRRKPVAALAILATFLLASASAASHAPFTPRARSAFGKASPRTVQSGHAERWSPGPIDVVLDGSLDDISPAAKDAVVAAFGTWMSSGSALSAVTVDRSTERGAIAHDGVNRVAFQKIKIAGHEKDLAITISYADATTGVIAEADTIFNAAYPFAVLDDATDGDDAACGKKFDLQNVATHELGHFFGLGEDMDDDQATMFVNSKPCQVHKRELTADDRAVMSALYLDAPADSTSPASGSASCSVTRGTSGNSSTALLLLAVATTVLVRRRRRARDSH